MLKFNQIVLKQNCKVIRHRIKCVEVSRLKYYPMCVCQSKAPSHTAAGACVVECSERTNTTLLAFLSTELGHGEKLATPLAS